MRLKETFARIPLSLRRFVVTGVMTVCVDAIVYALLLRFGAPVDWAKGIGLVAATAFAYVVNRFWAFSDARSPQSRIGPFLAVYAIAIALNVLVNRAGLALLGDAREAYVASWFLATAASSSWNYLGLRFLVFKRPAPAP